MTVYTQINDQKYHFISNTMLRDKVLTAGRRKIVFVEGYDDKVIFDILFEKEDTNSLYFLDISLKAEQYESKLPSPGGCEVVKNTLKQFVFNLDERRFYGVIDRDLKTDAERKNEIQKPCYDKRLFIFYSRYTIENYFVEVDTLRTLLERLAISEAKLFKLTDPSFPLELHSG